MIQAATTAAATGSRAQMAEGALRSLLVDGVIGGVGAVLAFLPQILILFVFIAVLEDCGYMARAAYLMDRLMVPRGLERQVVHSLALVVRLRGAGHHGHAGDRERTRPADDDPGGAADDLLGPAAGLRAVDRGVHSRTKLSGRAAESARADAGGAVSAGNRRGRGVRAAAQADDLRGRTPPFLMELPSYKWPSPRTVFFRVAERGWVFLRCAGT